MELVFSYLHDNNEECEFLMTDLINLFKGEYNDWTIDGEI